MITVLARIVQMVAEAQRSRAPIQRLAGRVPGWFVPLVIAVAPIAFAARAMFGPEPRFAYGLVAAATILIITCPCAQGLAAPTSILVGVGRGAQASEHPLAAAIITAARSKGLALSRIMGFDSPTDKSTFGIADPLKATTPEALAALRAKGTRIVTLTGNNRTTADAIARKLGPAEIEAEWLPCQATASTSSAMRCASGCCGYRVAARFLSMTAAITAKSSPVRRLRATGITSASSQLIWRR